MQVTILYLGGSRVQTNREREVLELPDGATVGDVAARVLADHPALAPLMASCRWARNLEFARQDEPLAEGDELALLPPVAGGAPATLLAPTSVDPEQALAAVAGPDVGATVLFVGTVRNVTGDRAVQSLEYEAYDAMAARKLEVIVDRCETENRGARLAIHHRTGRLEVGETSVVIAAAAAHREEAFAACRQALELIKADVPIWKKEISPEGESWVGWGGG